MPDLAVPSSSTAVPITSARSSKRPWPWLIHNWFAIASLATNRSGLPSRLTSDATMPSPLPNAACRPAACETSVNVPLPLLRYNTLESGAS